MRKNLFASVMVSIMLLFNSCSAKRSHTERTETTTTQDPAGEPSISTQTTVVEKSEEKSADTGSQGVLSTIVDGIGEVIAFPFRLIGGLFRAIF